MLDLPEDQLAYIREALARHLPGHQVIAFGSRANGKARKYSDLDLCIMGDVAPDQSAVWRLKDELEESPLPIRVDVIDWASTSPVFRAIIENQSTFPVQG